MNGCQFCGGTGHTTIDSFCRCSIGVALRIKSNADTARAYVRNDTVAPFTTRPHTDGIDDCTESIQGPIATGVFPDDDLTHETLAQRLTRTTYATPKLGHYCRGCHVELPEGVRCGALCTRCQEEVTALHKNATDKEAHWLYAVLFGLVAGCPVYFIIFKVVGWMP